MRYENLHLWDPANMRRYKTILAEMEGMTTTELDDPTNKVWVDDMYAFLNAFEEQTQAFVSFMKEAPEVPSWPYE